MTADPLLTLVAPAFNEADVLEDVLRELFDTIDHLPGAENTQVVVVDDGSSDGTWELARDYVASEPRLRAVRHEQNLGFGAAVRTGLEATETRYALMIPSDGQWDPCELAGFVAAAQDGASLAVGVRRGQVFYGKKRRILSAVYGLLVRVLFNVGCRDLAWVHLYDLHSVDWRTPSTATPFYPVEIALWNLRRGIVASASFRQLPSTMRMRSKGRTRIATPVVILAMLRDLLSCAWRVRRPQADRSQGA